MEIVQQNHGSTGLGPAPIETVALWVELVATMGPDELACFRERTYRQWDRASLGDQRRAFYSVGTSSQDERRTPRWLGGALAD